MYGTNNQRKTWRDRELPNTALRYVLESLIPYTEANIKLAFSPNRFFNDLEEIDRRRQYSFSSVRQAYYRAKREGLIVIDAAGQAHVTDKAKAALKVYQPSKLEGAQLVIIFDIPERFAMKRTRLRYILRELKFTPLQKSVWASDYDSRTVLAAEIADMEIEQYVRLFEARPLDFDTT